MSEFIGSYTFNYSDTNRSYRRTSHGAELYIPNVH